MRRSPSFVARATAVMFLALYLICSPSRASGNSASSLVIYVRISGGWHISRLIKSPPGSPYSTCYLTTYVQAGGKQRGRALYSAYGVQLEKRPEKTYHRQFGLTILNYRSGRTFYSRPVDTLIDISIHFHTYFGAPSTDPAYRISVHMARNGRTGTFLARHVGTTNLVTKWPHVTMQGWWRCSSVQRRSIPVM